MSITIQELLTRVKNLADDTKQRAVEFVVIPAASAMTANIINRNTNRGENTDGSKRDGYSKKPIYAGRDKFITKSFSPSGKTGSGNLSNGKQRKTQYFPGGYEQLRSVQGRRTDIKNYEYTGDTINAFGFGKNEKGVAIGFRNEKAAEIRKGLEERNGRAFPPSAIEIQEYTKEVVEETKKLQINILTGVE